MDTNTKDDLHCQAVSPPSLAILLLTWFLPAHIVDAILGDLLEEFSERVKDNDIAAKRWFWQQSLHTSGIYFKQVFNSPSVFKKLNILLAMVFFVLAFMLIAWLSYADNLADYAPGFWQTLLTGQAHMALFDGAFWASVLKYIGMIDDVWFLLDSPSLILAIFSLSLLVYLDKKSSFSPLQMACWGYALVVLPYFWSLLHINSNHFVATEIGPIIAIGLLSFLYMILPVSYLVHKKLKQAEIAIESPAYNKQEANEDF